MRRQKHFSIPLLSVLDHFKALVAVFYFSGIAVFMGCGIEKVSEAPRNHKAGFFDNYYMEFKASRRTRETYCVNHLFGGW